jgi:isocitrate dehydrogenase
MQIVRGRYTGAGVELLEPAEAAPDTHVLVLVLSGELERAAARVGRQVGAALGRIPEEPPEPRPQGARPHTVAEIMTERLVTVQPRMAAIRAMHLMAHEGVTSVLVEPGAAGDWGIMTMRDVLDRIVRTNRSADQVAVGELASRPLISVTPDTTLQECSALMIERKVRRVVVTSGGRPSGIVSETDIFRVVEQHGWGD